MWYHTRAAKILGVLYPILQGPFGGNLAMGKSNSSFSALLWEQCRRLGILTAGAATTLDEALALEAAGVDLIVASGSEGGGHCPSF